MESWDVYTKDRVKTGCVHRRGEKISQFIHFGRKTKRVSQRVHFISRLDLFRENCVWNLDIRSRFLC